MRVGHVGEEVQDVPAALQGIALAHRDQRLHVGRLEQQVAGQGCAALAEAAQPLEQTQRRRGQGVQVLQRDRVQRGAGLDGQHLQRPERQRRARGEFL